MKNAFRIGYYRYFDDNIFAEHINFIKRNIENIDEVALFVEFSHHGYWPIEGQKEMSALLAKRIEEYRKAGVKSVGLNVLDTIGHLEEAWDVLPKPYMQTMVGKDGRVSNSCLCINTEEFRQYIFERYQILAQCKPDFIWVDDDLRVDNHGVAGPCYCKNCIDKFNKITGRNENFESLTITPSEELECLWEDFCDRCIDEICTVIKTAAQSVDINIELGLMTGHTAKGQWFDSLSATKGRPGGGYYTDHLPGFIAEKFIMCELQLNQYPERIKDLQYEYENFPYQELRKSKTITELEALFALMSGCNGIAFNAVFFNDNQQIMDIVKQNKAQWEQIVKRCENTVNVGAYCGSDIGSAADFLRMGMPMTGYSQNPCVNILNKEVISQKSDDELKDILSSNAFVTGDGFELLEKRRLSYLCGVSTDKIYTNGVYECFTDDEINGSAAGSIRNSYINFGGVLPRIATLNIKSDVRVLSQLCDLLNNPLGACFTIYENELGGRVAVCTYVYTCHLGYISKRAQLLNSFEWLCGTLPVRILNDCRIAPVIRKGNDGKFLLMLSNMDFDTATNIQVDVDTTATNCVVVKTDGSTEKAESSVLQNGKLRITIPEIAPWSAVIISDK